MSNSEVSRLVADRYLPLEHLGSGGMGTVWRAADQLLGRTVALKEVRLHARGEELANRAQRAHREARAIARISHPGVINVHDLVDHDDRLYLVMELVDGPSLAEHIDTAGPMTPSSVAEIGLQLLAAVEAVHATGVLHRDIKPSNVLLRRDGRVVLCDFGIAALAGTDSLTTAGGVVGSPEYIAPERLRDQPAEPASDLFSLGSTLCALLFCRSPFARPEALAVMDAVAHEAPNIPDAAGPLRHPLEALLRKDPAERPSTAEAAGMLRPVTVAAPPADGAPGRTETLGAGSGTGSRGRRLLRPLVLSAVLLAVGGATAGVLVNRLTEGEGNGPPSKGPSADGNGSAVRPPARIDAVMPMPDDPGLEAPSRYWLFSGDRSFRARTSSSNHPVGKVLAASSPLSAWKATMGRLPGFRDEIDTVLRVPGHRDEYWVFSDDQYIRIRVADKAPYSDKLLARPRPISDWKDAIEGLPENDIDAVVPVPDDPNQVWFFSGDQYVRTELKGERPGGTVGSGPSGFEGWKGTLGRTPGFKKGIDEVMPVPGKPTQYWVFSGTQYMKIHVTEHDYTDTVLQSPRPLRD